MNQLCSSWNSSYHEAIAHADWSTNESSKAVQHLYDAGEMSIGCHIKFGSAIQVPVENFFMRQFAAWRSRIKFCIIVSRSVIFFVR